MNCGKDKATEAWPLERKIQVTQAKIIEWYRHYDGRVAVSWSAGKDSTVILDLARRAFQDIPAVFVDTGLEYPEIREFAKSVSNVTWLRPELPFTKVVEQYGLQNIFEVTFDGMERATQQERFERLCHIYPDVGKPCDPSTLPDVEPGQRTFRVNSILGLRLLELTIYFQQDAQRIARCDYCWGWFVPKTKKVTRYCDRVTDGFSCKKRGSRFKRNLAKEQDGALRVPSIISVWSGSVILSAS